MAPPLIFIIGGTGAQGLPVVSALVQDGRYAVRILTRDSTSARSRQLAAFSPNVSFLEGSFASDQTLRAGFAGCRYAFVNIDGFNSGEKTEIYWGMRCYEIAIESGVGFFVWANLDYVYKKSGYDAKFRTGHYDGKGRVGEWILQQNAANGSRMKSALFTTGPYIDMAISARTVMSPTIGHDSTGAEVMTWTVPLGTGAVPHVCLEDCGFYVRWLFDNQDRASGLDLEVAIAHIGYDELAAAFAKVTGRPAKYVDVDLATYWHKGNIARAGALSAGYNADAADPATMTVEQNFSGFWNMWKASAADNRGVIRRDYALLDKIFPGRVKSAEEWFRLQDARGRKAGEGTLWERAARAAGGRGRMVLKLSEDGRKGKL